MSLSGYIKLGWECLWGVEIERKQEVTPNGYEVYSGVIKMF